MTEPTSDMAEPAIETADEPTSMRWRLMMLTLTDELAVPEPELKGPTRQYREPKPDPDAIAEQEGHRAMARVASDA